MYLHQNISAKLKSTSSWSVGIGVIEYQHLKSYRDRVFLDMQNINDSVATKK